MPNRFFTLGVGDFVIVDYTGNIAVIRGDKKVITFFKYQNLSYQDLKRYSEQIMELITGQCGLSFEHAASNEAGICFNIIDSK